MIDELLEGELVLIVGKLSTKLKELTRVGVLWARLKDNEVLVLLPTGDIYQGHKRDIVKEEEHK